MRILVASDLHGSSYYAQELAKVAENKKCDMIALLGDIYNHGPRNAFPKEYAPMKVAEILNGMVDKLIVVKGNCDSEVDAMISEFDFVEQCKIVSGNKIFTLTHGHVFNKDSMPKNIGNCLIYGHFHTGFVQKQDGIVIANCGSVALPKNDIHSYIIIDDNNLQLWDINNDIMISNEIV